MAVWHYLPWYSKLPLAWMEHEQHQQEHVVDACCMCRHVRFPPSSEQHIVAPWQQAQSPFEVVRFLHDTLANTAPFEGLHVPVEARGIILGYPPIDSSRTKQVGASACIKWDANKLKQYKDRLGQKKQKHHCYFSGRAGGYLCVQVVKHTQRDGDTRMWALKKAGRNGAEKLRAARNDGYKIGLHRLVYQLSFGSIRNFRRSSEEEEEEGEEEEAEHLPEPDRSEYEALSKKTPSKWNNCKMRRILKRNRLEIVMHSCNQPDCFNPDHLYLGSRRENALWADPGIRQEVFNRRRKQLGLKQKKQQEQEEEEEDEQVPGQADSSVVSN
jgi:hypothetical protein